MRCHTHSLTPSHFSTPDEQQRSTFPRVCATFSTYTHVFLLRWTQVACLYFTPVQKPLPLSVERIKSIPRSAGNQHLQGHGDIAPRPPAPPTCEHRSFMLPARTTDFMPGIACGEPTPKITVRGTFSDHTFLQVLDIFRVCAGKVEQVQDALLVS